MKFNEKDKISNSNIWPATVLMKGHKGLVEQRALDVSMQIKNACGDENFQPIIDIHDPDLTLYESVNQIILQNKMGSKANKKLNLAPSTSTGVADEHDVLRVLSGNESLGFNEVAQINGECAMLDPDDVSRTLHEIEEGQLEQNAEMNCSAIPSDQVGICS